MQLWIPFILVMVYHLQAVGTFKIRALSSIHTQPLPSVLARARTPTHNHDPFTSRIGSAREPYGRVCTFRVYTLHSHTTAR